MGTVNATLARFISAVQSLGGGRSADAGSSVAKSPVNGRVACDSYGDGPQWSCTTGCCNLRSVLSCNTTTRRHSQPRESQHRETTRSRRGISSTSTVSSIPTTRESVINQPTTTSGSSYTQPTESSPVRTKLRSNALTPHRQKKRIAQSSLQRSGTVRTHLPPFAPKAKTLTSSEKQRMRAMMLPSSTLPTIVTKSTECLGRSS